MKNRTHPPLVTVLALALLTLGVRAGEPPSSAEPSAAEPKVPDSGAKISAVADATPADADPSVPKPRFEHVAKWETAGYNNTEVVYHIFITSHDDRILRCTTELQGAFYEDGVKQTVSDRQVSTVFPDQSVLVGNWLGMDEKSGATYSVSCKPI